MSTFHELGPTGAAEPIHMADEEQDDLYTGWWKTLPIWECPSISILPCRLGCSFLKDGTGVGCVNSFSFCANAGCMCLSSFAVMLMKLSHHMSLLSLTGECSLCPCEDCEELLSPQNNLWRDISILT